MVKNGVENNCGDVVMSEHEDQPKEETPVTPASEQTAAAKAKARREEARATARRVRALHLKSAKHDRKKLNIPEDPGS